MIPEAVQNILDGKDVARSIRSLKTESRAAIRYILAVVAGTRRRQLAPGRHPVDASDALLDALAELGKTESGYLVELFESALESGKGEPVFSLAWVLAHSTASKRVAPLMKAIKHKDEFVRWAACRGLHRARATKALALLNAAAADRASLVRSTAVDALAGMGDETSLPILTKRLEDRYPGIRIAAAKAIEAIEKRGRD